ncbi:DinB family protein [Psychroflexus sp. CAK8W]|uniref:DinB family protein n=1 Tax=Psychroflexus longus TaxID=2873596 RepID=A0ABS7XHL8_9FLAO|nr:DinB family protein [Psychroflexus longus]MBZ9778210.1 DinB family protein [Psychroflexus longus]
MTSKQDISNKEYKPYYDLYLNRVSSKTTLFEALEQQSELIDFFNAIPLNKHEFRYEPEKWTPKQILQHLIDTERIFVNRALRFAREDFTELPGYDENHYAEQCFSNQRSIKDLLEEYEVVRSSSIFLYKSFADQVLTNTGQASGGPFSVRVIPFILCGHQKHHIHIIKERYLKN